MADITTRECRMISISRPPGQPLYKARSGGLFVYFEQIVTQNLFWGEEMFAIWSR